MPHLLIHKKRCLANLERMSTKARSLNLDFRPHFKTHQSADVGSWYRDFGVNKITVSSFDMARYFSGQGWKDILVAFPFPADGRSILDELSSRIRISILLDHPDALVYLEGLSDTVNFYIDIDTGYGRSGIPAENPDAVEALLNAAGKNPRLNFQGFYCHAGHSYKAANQQEIETLHAKAMSDLSDLKQVFASHGSLAIYGDTPSCSTRESFSGIDCLSPGNFIYYDLMQVALGACTAEQVAVALKCPVCGIYPERGEIMIHGGGVHFSKEQLNIEGRIVYGQLLRSIPGGWDIPEQTIYLHSLSQEHGILKAGAELMEQIRMGDRLLFLPVHSCLAANLMQQSSLVI